MNIVVTGATGFIGSALVRELVVEGHRVVALTRDPSRAALPCQAVAANLEQTGPWCDALASADALVHLAGESVGARRWDARQKQRIRDSRIETTRVLVEALAALPNVQRPRVLVCASGVDYYPFALPPLDDDPVTEVDPPSESFLGRVCRDWEREAMAASALGVRVIAMRTGLVLGRGGGLAKLAGPFRWFVGGRLGSGRQWVSWIDLADAVGAYRAALVDERYRGPINLVRSSVRNSEFSAAVGAALRRPSWLPVPAFALRAAVGEFAECLLHGRNAIPARLDELGYSWRQPELARSLELIFLNQANQVAS